MAVRNIAWLSGLIFLIGILFQNCAKKENNVVDQTSISSEQAIIEAKATELLAQKCGSCHSGANAYSNAAVGTDPITDISNVDYLLKTRLMVPGEPELSPIFQMAQSAEMPPNQPLTISEVELLKKWILDYNKQVTPIGSGLPTAVPLAATFSSLRVNIFINKCFTCHANRTVRLDTYASVSSAINNNNLAGRVSNNTMPPVGAPQLTAQEKSLLQQWIDAGALNN
jgi:uncharacterized membrane protein